MKKHLLFAVVLCLVLVLSLAACRGSTGDNTQPEEPSSGNVVDTAVSVEAIRPTTSIAVGDLSTYPYTSLFVVREGEREVAVTPAMLSGIALAPTLDAFDVTCTYGDKSAVARVQVTYDNLVVDSDLENLRLATTEVAGYAFADLFTIVADGISIAVPADLVNADLVKAAEGVYPVTLTYMGQTAVITVSVYRPVEVVVRAGTDRIALKTDEVAGYDYAHVFVVTEDGKRVAWDKIEVDASAVVAAEGEYTVTCRYGEFSAQYVVTVSDPRFTVSLAKDSVRLTTKEVADFDFAALFSVTREGRAVAVDPAWVSSDVQAAKGNYTYTVSVFGATATLSVNVQLYYALEIVPAYNALSLALSRVETYPYHRLFAVYEEGVSVPVTRDMLSYDNSAVGVGDTFDVTISYDYMEQTFTATLPISVVEEDALVLEARDVQVFPNVEHLDLTTLFSIRLGGQTVPVTSDMLEGAVDYNTEGTYPINLRYEGSVATATVTVSRGVVIDYPHGTTILVQRGTDPEVYAFEEDVVVRVNGIRFDNVRDLIDIAAVDFDVEGDYPVDITVQYNSKPKTGMAGTVHFDETVGTITYRVLANRYSADVLRPTVALAEGTTGYNPLTNLSVSVNDRAQTLTTNPAYVNPITTYCEVLAGVDFDSVAEQQIVVAVYVQGLDHDPVTLQYTLVIDSGVRLVGDTVTVYSGDTVHRRDLFAITVSGEPVEVEESMIEGVLDVFAPGVYTLTLRYAGKSATATVNVLDSNILGTYHTVQTTIGSAVTAVSGGGYDDEWEVYDDDLYEDEDEEPVAVLDDLVITRESIMWGDRTLSTQSGVDMYTMWVLIGSDEHLLTYRDGIVTLDPENRYKLNYHATKRPLMFFNSKIWRIVDAFTINSAAAGHVISTSYSGGYSIDLALIEDRDGNRVWYAQKTFLEERSGSDYIFINTWGYATFGADLDKTQGATGTLTFAGEEYRYEVNADGVGVIVKETEQRLFASRSFSGTIAGQVATLSTDSYEHYTLRIGGETVISNLILSGYIYGEADYAGATLLLHHAQDRFENATYAYKFALDLEAGTFTYIEQDGLFGRYAVGSGIFFLDGYGRGYFSADTTKYYTTEIAYSRSGSDVGIRFLNTASTFSYGRNVVAYLHPFGNQLTVTEADYLPFVGTVWRNTAIVDGVLLSVANFAVGKAADASTTFLSGVEIVSATGAVTDANAKKAYFDFSKVNWNLAGFYLIEAKATVRGEEIRYPYTVQVLAPVYESAAQVGAYGAGVLTGTNSLVLDKYGQAMLSVGDTTYRGVYHTVGTGFAGRVGIEGAAINLVGELVSAEGQAAVYKVRGTGSYSFVDYYTAATSAVAATEGACIRRIGDLYVYAVSTGGLGEIVQPELLSGDALSAGAIFRIGTRVYKLVAWGNTTYGLAFADSYRGTYTLEEAENLVLDGFGSVALGEAKGSYVMNGRVAIVTIKGATTLYKINPDNHTYTVSDIVLDNTLLENKSYTASYTISGQSSYDTYAATVRFDFATDGVVYVSATSSEYEQDTGATYRAVFAAKGGTEGAYTVSGTQVTVKVEGYTFVLDITNVSTLTQLACASTNVLTGDMGYFAKGTVFNLV